MRCKQQLEKQTQNNHAQYPHLLPVFAKDACKAEDEIGLLFELHQDSAFLKTCTEAVNFRKCCQSIYVHSPTPKPLPHPTPIPTPTTHTHAYFTYLAHTLRYRLASNV